jgi:hypothetical protein
MLPVDLLPKLSRVLDVPAQRRLIDGWKDPEVTTAMLQTRFLISKADVELLKAFIGPKAKPLPVSPWWKQERTRRNRSALLSRMRAKAARAAR